MDVVPGVCEVPQQPIIALYFYHPLLGLTEERYRLFDDVLGAKHPDLAYAILSWSNASNTTQRAIPHEDGRGMVTDENPIGDVEEGVTQPLHFCPILISEVLGDF